MSAVQLSKRSSWAAEQPIADMMARALANPDLVSLAAGFVDQETLPTDVIRSAMDSIWSDPGAAAAALQYGTTAGYPPLRETLLRRFLQDDGIDPADSRLSPDQVIVTSGSNPLLHLLGETLFDPGDVVLCAAPTYLVYLGTLASLGARAVGVAVDRFGILPEALDRRFAQLDEQGRLHRVKSVYIVTYFDNPRGVSMPLARRADILDVVLRWSKTHRIHVIEDVAYRELRYACDDIPSMHSLDPDGETVIVAGTFSKSFSPGLRVGWGIMPSHLVGPVHDHKANIDFGSPNVCQHLMARILDMDLFDPHVEKLRSGYREKLDATLAAADEMLAPLEGVSWIKPAGGLYVWVQLPESIDSGPSGTLLDRAVEAGMLYVPGEHFYPPEGEPVRRNMIRLSFGVQSCEAIHRGIAALAKAIEQEL